MWQSVCVSLFYYYYYYFGRVLMLVMMLNWFNDFNRAFWKGTSIVLRYIHERVCVWVYFCATCNLRKNNKANCHNNSTIREEKKRELTKVFFFSRLRNSFHMLLIFFNQSSFKFTYKRLKLTYRFERNAFEYFDTMFTFKREKKTMNAQSFQKAFQNVKKDLQL